MRLVDIATGVEYKVLRQPNASNGYGDRLENAVCLEQTSKVYLRHEGYANIAGALDGEIDLTSMFQGQDHKALTFLEPIEVPMPKLEAGDYAEQGDYSSFYVMADCLNMYVAKPITKLYRNGKLIWERA